MPAPEGQIVAVGIGLGSPSESIDLGITFSSTPDGSGDPIFIAPGMNLRIYAIFQWSYNGSPVEVQGFLDGHIAIDTEDNEEVEDLIRLGNVNRGGVAREGLSGGPNGRYVLPLLCNPNSAASVAITVLPNSAYHIPMGQDARIYGPEFRTWSTFSYTTIPLLPKPSTPVVTIVMPGDLPFSGGTATVHLDWDREMRDPSATISIGTDADDHIRLEVTETNAAGNARYVADSFETTLSGQRMSFDLTLNGSGQCKVTVGSNDFTDQEGKMGPASDTSNEFIFDTSFPPTYSTWRNNNLRFWKSVT